MRDMARRPVAVLAALVLAATTLAGRPAGATSGGDLLYALIKPLCAAPSRPDQMRCFALERKVVAKGTRGAEAVTDVGRGPAGGYTPGQLAAAYGYSPNRKASNQLVAVVDWYDDPHALADLNAFDAHYDLPKETGASFRKVNQDGRTSPLPARNGGESSPEIALDIEAVRAVCHTCRILLVEANSPSGASIARAENTAARLGATEISNSFGGSELGANTTMQQAFRHPGIVITAATGDDGWNDYDLPAGQRGTPAQYPSTDPHVVAVGGTNLVLHADDSRWSERVWNGDATGSKDGASGGGCSVRFPAPQWQAHHAGYSAANCSGKRLAADIAAIADPMHGLDILDTDKLGGWATIGGTSLSSPVVAALFALAGGAGTSAWPAASLYLNGIHRARDFWDVTVGGNSYCGYLTIAQCEQKARSSVLLFGKNNPNANGHGIVDCSFPRTNQSVTVAPTPSRECNAARGYDGPSGLGAPKNLAVFTPTSPRVSISSTRVHRSVSFVAHVREPVRWVRAAHYRWTWGDGHSSWTTHAGIRHTYAHAGRYRVTVRVTDSQYQTVYRSTTITIAK